MAYTPRLSLKSSQTLRRIAWAMDKPMTQTLETLVIGMPMFMDRERICSKCRDKSLCRDCLFSERNHKICPKTFQ